MLIIAKILDVSIRDHVNKTTKLTEKVADVTITPTDAGQPFRTTIWSKGVTAGDHVHFQQFVGKGEVILSATPEVFNGRLQWGLNATVRPKLMSATPKAAA